MFGNLSKINGQGGGASGRTHVKRACQHSAKVVGFPPHGKLTGWVRINTVKKVISQLL